MKTQHKQHRWMAAIIVIMAALQLCTIVALVTLSQSAKQRDDNLAEDVFRLRTQLMRDGVLK